MRHWDHTRVLNSATTKEKFVLLLRRFVSSVKAFLFFKQLKILQALQSSGEFRHEFDFSNKVYVGYSKRQ